MSVEEDRLIAEAMSAPGDLLMKSESDALMEFLWELRSGGSLTGVQRARLHAICEKVRKARKA